MLIGDQASQLRGSDCPNTHRIVRRQNCSGKEGEEFGNGSQRLKRERLRDVAKHSSEPSEIKYHKSLKDVKGKDLSSLFCFKCYE